MYWTYLRGMARVRMTSELRVPEMIGKQRGCLVMLRKPDFECELMYNDGSSHSPRRARASQAALVAGLVLQAGVLVSQAGLQIERR